MKKIIILIGLCLFLNCEDTRFSTYYIEEKCIRGHLYYFNNGYNAGGIALKVDDEGRPIKCEEK